MDLSESRKVLDEKIARLLGEPKGYNFSDEFCGPGEQITLRGLEVAVDILEKELING